MLRRIESARPGCTDLCYGWRRGEARVLWIPMPAPTPEPVLAALPHPTDRRPWQAVDSTR